VITSEAPRQIASYELQVRVRLLSWVPVWLSRHPMRRRRDFGDGKTTVVLDAADMHVPLKIKPRKPGIGLSLCFGKRKKLQDFL